MPKCVAFIPHHERMTEQTKALSVTAFATLLLVAFMMGRLQRFSRSGFKRLPTEHLDASLAVVLG